MGSSVVSSGDLAGAQTLGEPSGEPYQSAAGVASGGTGRPRVSELNLFPGAFPDAALDGDAESGEGSEFVDVEGVLELESRYCASTEVVEEVELGLAPNGVEVIDLEASQESEKIEDSDATGGGNWRAAEKEGDGGGGREPVVVGAAENPFLAGDFVWGKIKSHPWWPAQVYDSSDASEYAKKVRRRDQQCVLVAYFGDRTFAWCDPSQLRPFTEGFQQMAQQSITKNFVGALKEALDEMQRCLESEMACACVPAAARAGLFSRRTANAGVKEGAAVPRGRVKALSIVDYVPAELLQRLHEITCDVSTAGLMEVVAIKGWLSAFNRWMGWHAGLPAQHRAEEVDGPVEVSAKEPAEKGSLSSPAGRRHDAKGQRSLEDKSWHRKKVRSMAELIAETDMDTDAVEDDVDGEKEPAFAEKPASSGPRERKKGETKSSDAGNTDAGYEEGLGSGRRERKRSKYLSPPYTTLIAGRAGHHPISPRDGEAVHPKKNGEASEEGMESTGAGSTGSPLPTILKCNTEAAGDNTSSLLQGGGASADAMLSEFRSAALNPMYLKGNRSSSRVRIFFDRFRSYSYANISDYGKTPSPKAGGRAPAFRTVTHVKSSSKAPVQQPDGSMEGKPGPDLESKSTPGIPSGASKRKPDADRKKKSLGGDANDTNTAKPKGKRKSVGQDASGAPEQVKPEKKRKKGGEVINGDAGAAVLLTFAPGIPLPTKQELISAFSKFGALCEPETELLRDSGGARVVFARSSDAEKVFETSHRSGALGPGIAGCRVQYLHDNNLSAKPLPPPGQKPPLHFVQRSLESMISALRESSSPASVVAGPSEELKPEARENLVDEMSGLLKKVNKMLGGSAAGAT